MIYTPLGPSIIFSNVLEGLVLSAMLDLHLPNDRHHRVAGVDFDLRKRWPPPLRCMAWFAVFHCVTVYDPSILIFQPERADAMVVQNEYPCIKG